MRSLILPEALVPVEGERPTVYADRIGRAYSLTTSAIHKKGLGQYLTPIAVADYMASRVRRAADEVCILDPGSGSGVLACAMAERICRDDCRTKRLLIDVYECDEGLLPLLNRSLQYLGQRLDRHGVSLEYRIVAADFVLEHGSALRRGGSLFQIDSQQREYDIVVSNPPYFKLPKSDPRAMAASQVVHGQPNIYALFMAISASLLKPGGELIFITPRSFTSGPYFRRFREQFFSKLQLEALHVFDSRRDAFSRDGVLQENLIIKGRCRRIGEEQNKKASVQVSVSAGAGDIDGCKTREVQLSALLDMKSNEKMLRISSSDDEDRVISRIDSWPGLLGSYGLQVSTGPVVPFRAEELLAMHGTVPDEHAPLLWLHNVRPMSIEWPTTARRKPQYISTNFRDSRPLLVRNQNYVLLRRFSAKEERRRLTAAPLVEGQFSSEWIGIENHVNYIHRPGGSLSPEESFGLAIIYNSEFMDTYFRILNGSTQVSATELRRIPLPPLELIVDIGRLAMQGKLTGAAEAELAQIAFAAEKFIA